MEAKALWKFLRPLVCAGSVAELNVRILLGSLDHEALVAEAVGENNGAALLGKVGRRIEAGSSLADAGLLDDLNAKLLAGFLSCGDEVLVIS